MTKPKVAAVADSSGKDKSDESYPFHPHLAHHMAGFQSMQKSQVWNMQGFIKQDEPRGLKEQELFYRATDYRGS